MSFRLLTDEELKKATGYQRMDFLKAAQNYVSSHLSILKLEGFTFDPEHCSIKYENQWGIYSNKPSVFTDPKIVSILSEKISNCAKGIINGIGKIPRTEYRMAITHIQRYLTHLIPSEDALAILLQAEENLEQKIDTSLVVSDYTICKAGKVLPEGYVYAIMVKDKVMYIGETTRPLLERLKEHWEGILNAEETKDKKYEYLASFNLEDIEFKILYQVIDGISEYDLKNIERALIEAYQPILNKEGVTLPYGEHDLAYKIHNMRLPFYKDQFQQIEDNLKTLTATFEKLSNSLG